MSPCPLYPPATEAGCGTARCQGLTLVNFSAQLKRILSERGAFKHCFGGVYEVSRGIQEYQGVFRVNFVSETAQVELKIGRL